MAGPQSVDPRLRVPPVSDLTAAERREQLIELYHQVRDCHACPLGATRTNAVFGMGNADADLMFVGEAPGAEEDRQGKPFVGRAGKLLDQLLGEIGMDRRQDAFIANVLKSRPPGNRDPQPEEIEACRPYLERQIQLIEPRVICTLGNFATKLLSGSPVGITRCCGRPQERVVAGLPVILYPLFHPAAALRTPSVLERLREDFSRIPALIEQARPAVEEPPAPVAVGAPAPTEPAEPAQLDLLG
ncbi:MAG: uracil-DNA glycosylase [Thermoleophilaceae bacterium]|nr:uracil-DNA glycosylase [Thermoleophilaceae bacterium]